MPITYDDLEQLGFKKVLADYQEGGWAFEAWRSKVGEESEWYLYIPEEGVDRQVTVLELSSWVNDYLLCNLSAFMSSVKYNEVAIGEWYDWCRKLVKEPALLSKNDGILYAGFTFLRDLTTKENQGGTLENS